MKFRLTFALTAALALAGLSATASPAAGHSPHSFVSPTLMSQAHASPNARVRVIVQSASVTSAEVAVISTGGLPDGDRIGRRLGLVHGVAAEMKAKRVAKLADAYGLIVTPDARLLPADFSSDQLWPYESGNASLWRSVDDGAPGSLPTIAVVDSGIDPSMPDVAGRVIASVDLSTATPNSSGDGRGHGTFVASSPRALRPATPARPPARISSRSMSSTTTGWAGRAT